MPRTRAEELTYYDELGVVRDATPDQIRDSFRVLVRLLHPDQHTDEQLKSVAELQMRKLNRIYAVLSDPAKRRTYDDLLEEDRGPATPLLSEKLGRVASSRTISRVVWLSAVLVVGLLIMWLAAEGPQGPISAITERVGEASPLPHVTGATQPDAAAEVAHLRADLRIARFERDAAIRELSKLRGTPVVAAPPANGPVEPRRAEPPPSPPVTTLTELPSHRPTAIPTTTNPEPVVRPPATRLTTRPFNGFWFFVRTPQEKKNPGTYPPEFIEATIMEQSGQVRGRYRSRYRIVDRAISPDVNFDFTGTINVATNTITANWTGAGGARGEVTMRLLTEHSLRVEWTADQLGSIQGLTSGTAALTRRLD